MNIVMINGQNHKGSTYHIGRQIADKIEGSNEITEFFLPKDLNHFCMGCYNCIEDDKTCPFYEEKWAIMQKVEEADVLIFTTPTYCLHASAPMKSFLDLTFTYWMSHRPRKAMFTKRACIVSTSAGASPKSAIEDIAGALLYWGVPQVKRFGIAVQAMSWDGVSHKKKEAIEKKTTKLAKELSKPSKPSVGIKTRFLFWMMGNMQKAGWGSSPVEKEYWQQNGWLSGKKPWRV